MKTLGQIAYEATETADDLPWEEQVSTAPYWERMAQAVRAAVIDEIASMWHDPENEHAKAIRALKDKR